MSAAAGGFPSWLFLEPYVFRRDDDEDFPDESDAPIRASGTTSRGARFRIAFSMAEPPRISRIYAQLPELSPPIGIVATPHRHLALLLATTSPFSEGGRVQNLFIFRANQGNPSSSSLQMLPSCTEPKFDNYLDDIRCVRPSNGTPRLLDMISLGLWCGDQEDFVVAELTLLYGRTNNAFAEICMLRGHCTTSSSSPLHQVGDGWKSVRVEILSGDDIIANGACGWGTNTAIGFQRWLCWIDYHKGILFCDMSNELPVPTVSFLRFPLDKSTTCSGWYAGASVVSHGRALKFVNIARHDGIPFGALKPGTGFSITCHTLVLLGGGGDGMAWKKDYTVTSNELWDANPLDRLPRGILMFPQVDVDRPQVVHFVFNDFTITRVVKKMWAVSPLT
ncbi:unnamed protein product [Urochloa humidicola]